MMRKIMIPFLLSRELKSAGFTQSASPDAVYALSEHLRIRRENALQMWYGSKAKEGVPLRLEEDAVFVPTLSDLVIACGKPLQLACDEGGNWQACTSADAQSVGAGETPEEALGRLWLEMRKSI
jgi:hypothetical protein